MELDPKDLIIETYRSAGQGGWIFRPDLGVQITHIPTGLQVSHHEDRSQFRNKVVALERLTEMVSHHMSLQLLRAEAEAKLVAGPGMMSEGQIKQIIARYFAMTRSPRRAVNGGEKPAVALHLIINEVYAQAYRDGLRHSGVHSPAAGQARP